MATETAGAAKTAGAVDESGRGKRRVENGIVVSDVRNKTITVEIKHLVKHPRYGKYLNRSTLLHAHDEKDEARKGDRVEIVETRPISKQKRWRLIKIVEKAAVMGQLDIKEVDTGPAKKAPAPAADSAAEGAPKA